MVVVVRELDALDARSLTCQRIPGDRRRGEPDHAVPFLEPTPAEGRESWRPKLLTCGA